MPTRDQSLAIVLSFALCALLAAAAPGCSAAPAPSETPARDDALARRHLEDGIQRLQNEHDPEPAIESLRLAIASASPAAAELRVEAHRWIGHARTLGGDPEGALTEYRLALAEAPRDPWLHYASGICWNTMGDTERALESFTRALESDPRHVKALQWRGEVRHALGDEQAALSDLTQCCEAIDRSSDAELAAWGADRRGLLLMTLALRIEVLAALGDAEGARRDRERREALLAHGPGGGAP